ncbi:MAG: PD-(D/E)XK nuclease family protein, partial [Planctomycetota bacterium]
FGGAMPNLIDLLPLGLEVSCCTALGLLLQSEPEGALLRDILGRVKPIDGRDNGTPWSKSDLDKKVRNLEVSVEEEISTGKIDRRLDLVLRFDLDEKPCRVLVEAKVGAAGEHGGQIAAYQECLEEWSKDLGHGARVIGVLLTAAPLDEFEWTTKREDRTFFHWHLSWKDVCEAIQSRIDDRKLKDDFFARLGGDLNDILEEWIMGLKELQERLSQPSPHCYPVLIDALEMVARQASGNARLNREPPGVEGAPWDDKEKAYWCGYWWRVRDNWAELVLSWDYKEKRVKDTEAVSWVSEGKTTGYEASVQLIIGSEGDLPDRELHRWSLERFGQELEDLPGHIGQLLSENIL